MDAEWRVYSKRADFNYLAKKYNIDPVVARILRNRDLTSEKDIEMYLYGTLNDCHDPHLLLDMDKAVDIMAEKIKEKKKIRIVSDYDVDGVTSNYILFHALKTIGADVSYDIPDRIKDGYGMNIRIVDEAFKAGVDTIITCDNGIAAFSAIDKAKEYGMTVIVTDHHEIQEKLPDADAIVDPHRDGDNYPFKGICGAMVAYKFIRCLYEKIGQKLDDGEYIEFLATATVCDVMPLRDENRIYVKEGLKELKKTKNIGYRALLKARGLDDGRDITSYHLGFVLGPCINAEGRLSSAVNALNLFLSQDEDEAYSMALQASEINDERKKMTEEGTKTAISMVAEDEDLSKDNVLVLYISGLHESLAGIVAGRVREAFYKPVIVFTDAENNDEFLKGSGRSVEGYNMFEELCKVSDLQDHFGGHPMAAGTTIPKDNLLEFRKKLNENEAMSRDTLTQKIYIDVPMPLSYPTIGLIRQLEELSPFGTANERPLFAEAGLLVTGARIFGKNGNVMKIAVKEKDGRTAELTSFDVKGFTDYIKKWFSIEQCDKMLKGIPSDIVLDMAYQPGINEYNGRISVQNILKAYRIHGDK